MNARVDIIDQMVIQCGIEPEPERPEWDGVTYDTMDEFIESLDATERPVTFTITPEQLKEWLSPSESSFAFNESDSVYDIPLPFSLVDLAAPTPPPSLWLADPESWRLYASDVYDPSAWFGRFDDPPVSRLGETNSE